MLLAALRKLSGERRAKLLATGALALTAVSLIAALFWIFGHDYAAYLVLLSSVSLGLLLWALPDVRLGLAAAFLFVQPLLIYLPNTGYGYTKAVFSLGAISLLLVVWASELLTGRAARIRWTPLLWPILALLGASSLSLVNGQGLLADLQYVVLLVYFALLWLYLVNHVEDRGGLRFLLGALLGAAALAALYGFLQYYAVWPGAPDHPWGGGAMISTFGNPNYLGGFLAYLAAPGLLLLLGAESFWTRLYALGALALIPVALGAINSDSAWLAYALSQLVALGGLAWSGQLDLLRRLRRWGWGLLGAVLGLTLAHYGLAAVARGFWVTTGVGKPATLLEVMPLTGWLGIGALALLPLAGGLAPYLGRLPRRGLRWAGAAALLVVLGLLVTPPGQSLAARAWEAFWSRAGVRAQDWRVGYFMFQAHPLLGVGLGDYKREFLPARADFLATGEGAPFRGPIQRAAQAHNEYVQILAELGIVGALATVAFLGVLLFTGVRRVRGAASPEVRLSVVVLFGGVVAFMSDAVFSFPLHLPANALALVALLGWLHSPALGSGAAIALGKRARQITAGLMVVIALTVGVFAYRDWRADVLLDEARSTVGDNPRRAEELLEESVRLDFAPEEALYWLGAVKLARGDLQASQGFLERSIALYNTERSYYLLATTQFRLGENASARRTLERLFAMYPRPSLENEARYLYAFVLYRLGEVEAAVSALEALIRSDYQVEKMHLNLGELFVQQGQPERARDHLEKALELIERELSKLDDSGSLRRQELEGLKARAEELLRQLSS